MRIETNVFNNKAFRVYAYVSMKLYLFYEKLLKLLYSESWKVNHVYMKDVLNLLLRVKNFQEMRIMESMEIKEF